MLLAPSLPMSCPRMCWSIRKKGLRKIGGMVQSNPDLSGLLRHCWSPTWAHSFPRELETKLGMSTASLSVISNQSVLKPSWFFSCHSQRCPSIGPGHHRYKGGTGARSWAPLHISKFCISWVRGVWQWSCVELVGGGIGSGVGVCRGTVVQWEWG